MAITVTFAFAVSVEPSGYVTFTGTRATSPEFAFAGGVAVTVPVLGFTLIVQPSGTLPETSNCVPLGIALSATCGTSTD